MGINQTDDVYAGLIQKVLTEGELIQTRNAEAYRIFAEKVQFTQTPLVSVRKTAWRNALREWEWFMSGSNRLDDLHPGVRHWWAPFATITPGTLHFNYGNALRRHYSPDMGQVIEVPARNSNDTSIAIVQGEPSVCGIGYLGNPNGRHPAYDRAYRLWYAMLERCYQPKLASFRDYGAKGVRVAHRWHCFETFLSDISGLPGYEQWFLNRGEYELDKDYYGSSLYGPRTCVFLPVAWNLKIPKSPGRLTLKLNGRVVGDYISGRDLMRHFGIKDSYRPSRGLPAHLKKAGYEVEVTANDSSRVFRYSLINDQIANLIDGIRNHPYSRRHAITTWHPVDVKSGMMNPTNCHNTITQAFVQSDNTLHLETYQRSADVIVGLPANWIQMWAFMMWLAHRSGRKVGSLTWIGGDIHVYERHRPLADKIVRAWKEHQFRVPQLFYSPSSDAFKADDFGLDGDYQPIVQDRAEMIV